MAWHDSWTSMRKKRPQETPTMDYRFSTDDSAAAETTSQQERVDLHEGVHELAVKTVAEDDTQLVLELAHDDRRYWWAKLTLKKGHGWARALVAQFAGALAMTEAEWLRTNTGDLVGRRVMAEIRHRRSDTGRVFVNVVAFAAIPELEDEAKSVLRRSPRTAAAKVRASAGEANVGGADDIPF